MNIYIVFSVLTPRPNLLIVSNHISGFWEYDIYVFMQQILKTDQNNICPNQLQSLPILPVLANGKF
jgi:hypothetical protein